MPEGAAAGRVSGVAERAGEGGTHYAQPCAALPSRLGVALLADTWASPVRRFRRL